MDTHTMCVMLLLLLPFKKKNARLVGCVVVCVKEKKKENHSFFVHVAMNVYKKSS